MDDIERAYTIYDNEFIGKGFDRRLRRIEGLPQSDYKRHFEYVFPILFTHALTVKMNSHQDIISYDEEAVRLKHEVIAAIDSILEKSEGE